VRLRCPLDDVALRSGLDKVYRWLGDYESSARAEEEQRHRRRLLRAAERADLFTGHRAVEAVLESQARVDRVRADAALRYGARAPACARRS
jgi:hypothetical protein